MRIGVFIASDTPTATPELLVTMATTAEAVGFSSLWLGEHVVSLDEYESKHPYASDGKLPLSGAAGVLEPFAVLSFMAASTSTIRLGTAVCILPQRHPVHTAKEVTTVDWLSGGRIDLGIGVGWLREEFAALGVPFDDRAQRCREYIEIMRCLWAEPISEYAGEFYTLPRCRMYPKPIQQPSPPVYFGGESDAALRRVADLGQGWHAFNLTPTGTKARVERLNELLEERGRQRKEVDVTVCPFLLPVAARDIGPYHDAGVDQLVLFVPVGSPAEAVDTLERLSEQFIVPAQRL